MNNITLDDIDQNRPPPEHRCFWCHKEFKWMEPIKHHGGAGWTPFDYHPKCFAEYEKKCKENTQTVEKPKKFQK